MKLESFNLEIPPLRFYRGPRNFIWVIVYQNSIAVLLLFSDEIVARHEGLQDIHPYNLAWCLLRVTIDNILKRVFGNRKETPQGKIQRM